MKDEELTAIADAYTNSLTAIWERLNGLTAACEASQAALEKYQAAVAVELSKGAAK